MIKDIEAGNLDWIFKPPDIDFGFADERSGRPVKAGNNSFTPIQVI